MKVFNKQNYYRFTDFQNLQDIGMTWINRLSGYFPIGIWIQKASIYQIGLWAIGDIHFWIVNIPTHWIQYWMIIVFLAIKFYLMILWGWILGKIVIKIGLRNAELQYNAKTKHLNPYEAETRAMLEEICRKVGGESKYTSL